MNRRILMTVLLVALLVASLIVVPGCGSDDDGLGVAGLYRAVVTPLVALTVLDAKDVEVLVLEDVGMSFSDLGPAGAKGQGGTCEFWANILYGVEDADAGAKDPDIYLEGTWILDNANVVTANLSGLGTSQYQDGGSAEIVLMFGNDYTANGPISLQLGTEPLGTAQLNGYEYVGEISLVRDFGDN